MPSVSDALRDVWGDYTPSSTVVQGAYRSSFAGAKSDGAEKEYEAVMSEIEAFSKSEGRRCAPSSGAGCAGLLAASCKCCCKCCRCCWICMVAPQMRAGQPVVCRATWVGGV